MNADGFRFIAEQVFNELPDEFRSCLENVVIITDDFADADTLAAMHIDAPFDLLGLYEGVPMPERQAVESGLLPDVIHLYRKPILAMQAECGESLPICIRHVLVHEIGHHFGFSDAQMHAFEL
ncbi:MAG: hypothetical protein CO187_09735 [Zetaproteobacteria bacterium CG_4_9_14_3_um_filter_53_7]|nr:MAG: hypothetical protein CO187_09735 [Zetaproteobacteria bacterium CG_4_9_14_3_um_filter_53_7]